MKTSGQIRQEFLEFFKNKEHVITKSAPVVPKDDPTLLFTNAGMNQFKPIFLGDETVYHQDGKSWTRAANTQKCIRVSGKHNDLEEVGHDTYHHTLFEMLGNWSFGDYFKEDAIKWAWELLVDKWGLDPDRLYATVFGGDEKDKLPVDEEAIALWKRVTNINPNHILKFGKKDNFWEMGDTGPCGPCSEIHVDLRTDEERAAVDGSTLVNADNPRVMEIWNLVFIQFNRVEDGSLNQLPAKHVDTGMGFERICAVIQGKSSNYDSDVFVPIINEIASISKISYGISEKSDIAMRVIADHIRAVSFGIADGASPSNDGRGYVIRRILRRAIRYGWDALNLREPFMYRLLPVIGNQFIEVFPELNAQLSYVENVIKSEEESFLKTLGSGIQLFEDIAKNKSIISGDDAFKLHDTYGFPFDLTNLMARERGLSVDENTFNQLMNEQKERARKAGKFTLDTASKSEWVWVYGSHNETETTFIGYDNESIETRVLAYRNSDKGYHIILETTPFYAESGGQSADSGTIKLGEDVLEVFDVQKSENLYIHFTKGTVLDFKKKAFASIDALKRAEIKKHHSATHLVHAALRQVLGNHVVQKGSLVNEHKLRFDFSHYESINQSQLDEIERIVNEKIQQNIPLEEERDLSISEAKSRGAMMLFGEKYGEFVRMITFDSSFSVELCGGTHVNHTGEIGYFRFVSESSVAAGIRRIEAVTGLNADLLLRREKLKLQKIQQLTGAQTDALDFIEQLIKEKKLLEKELDKLRLDAASNVLDDLINKGELVSGIKLVKGEIPGADMANLKQLGYDAINKVTNNTIVILASCDYQTSKVYLMAAVTDDLIQSKGLKAGTIVGGLAKIVGGGGGGQPNLATAGGKQPEKLNKVFEDAAEIVKNCIQ